MNKILITGATGFVGHMLVGRVLESDHGIRVALRQDSNLFPSGIDKAIVEILGEKTNWNEALELVDVVIHLAARVHVMQDSASNPLEEFRKVNTEGTLDLARQAAVVGVKRFIFISSIKVNGEFTKEGVPFTAMDTPAPQDPYGVSKLEAEQGLLALAQETGMEVVIIRPPLVYGPGVKANFLKMMVGLNRGLPLPLGAVHNKRSLVALDNLVDLILTCIDHPAAANEIFLVSDDEDLSTPELLQRMARAMGKSARLLPVPEWLLRSGAALLGKRDVTQRLLNSLQLDITKTKEVLNWTPPVSVDEALKRTAENFLDQQSH